MRPYAPVSKPDLLDEGRVPRGVSPGACPQGRVPRGVSPGAYRGAQGRSLKNTWKMLVFNCIHLVTCTCNYLPNHRVIGVSVASLDAESRLKSATLDMTLVVSFI